MKNKLRFVVWNFLIITTFFLLAELAIRYFYPQISALGTSRHLFIDSLYYDSSGLKKLSSGVSNGIMVKVDEYGFWKYRKAISLQNSSLLILGDSVTMGIGVQADSTFVGLMHTCLTDKNALNPSMIGYNIRDYYNLTRHFIIDRNNDFRISDLLIFWCLNDVYTDVTSVEQPGGKLRYVFSDLLIWIRSNSRLYMFIKTLFFDRPKTYFDFDKKYYAQDNSSFRNSIDYFLKIKEICTASHINFTIFLLPYEYQFRDKNLTDNPPQQLMVEELHQKNVTVLNIAVNFDHVNDEKQLYLYGDGIHFSPKGHRYIFNYLKKHYYLLTGSAQ
ncbi:SGNH/GDSL hydrolase family protein [candidate division KSB1 bacterium]|nr:SGNH/GDSL hydrolase family protein [candidate division KSB1 bacterium]